MVQFELNGQFKPKMQVLTLKVKRKLRIVYERWNQDIGAELIL